MSIKKKSKITFSKLWQQVDFRKTSTITLIISNLLVIFFAIVDNFAAKDLLWIYWLQSVIIGGFTFARMITLKNFSTEGFKQGNKQMPPTRGTSIFASFFFLFHYGLFHFVYLVFLASFSFIDKASNNRIDSKFILLSAGMFFISYFIEYIKSKKEAGDELPNIGKIMFAPYARIIPMHLTIIFGGVFLASNEFDSAYSNLAVIILFTGIKTVVDLITHSIDLKKLSKQPETVTE